MAGSQTCGYGYAHAITIAGISVVAVAIDRTVADLSAETAPVIVAVPAIYRAAKRLSPSVMVGTLFATPRRHAASPRLMPAVLAVGSLVPPMHGVAGRSLFGPRC